MEFKIGDARWAGYRHRFVNDLYWAASVVLELGDVIPMRPTTHALFCKFVEGKTGSPLLDEAHYKKIEMPRETGKSSLLRAYVIQRICANRNTAILLINEKELLARDFLNSIKWQFENNDLLRSLFPEVIPPDLNDTVWSATRIIVQRDTSRPDPTVDIAGVGAALAGKHPDIIIGDDIISREAMENARAGSWQIMHQTNRWIHQLDPIVNKSAKPHPLIVFVGTRWWHNDSYEHIEEAYGNGEQPRHVVLRTTFEDGATQQLGAYRVGDLAVFRRAAIEDGRSIFPEKWSLDDLAKMRMRDPALFAANYMNQPSDERTATFRNEWLKTFTWLDAENFYFIDSMGAKKVFRLADLDILMLIDPGGFGVRQIEDRARAAVAVVGDDHNGHKFFLDCYAEQDTFLNVIRRAVVLAQKYHPRKIYSERAGQQAAFSELLRQALTKVSCTVPVDDTTLKPTGVKEVRILEMEPFFQRGEVYIGTGPAFHEFRTQYAQFPRAQRLDVLDVLGYWPRLMKRVGVQRDDQRREQEIAAYRMRRTWR